MVWYYLNSTHPEYDVECEESELDTRVAGKCSSSPTVSTASTAAEASSQTHRRSSWSVCTAECAECRGLDSIANIHAAYSYFCNVTDNQTLSQQSTKCNVTDLLCPRPDRREGGNKSVAFVSPSVAYIANNSTTQRPSVPKFGWKDQHLRCDSHTSFKVKLSKVRVRGGRGHAVSAEPGGNTACFHSFSAVINHMDFNPLVCRIRCS